MKKIIMMVILVCAAFGGAFGQEKPKLAVLPFSGGQGDEGEDLAEKFSYEKALGRVFAIVPRTNINRAIEDEAKYQKTSGMTDPDTLADIGNRLGAQFVMSGSITRLGNRSFLIISILHIEDQRQISGDIQVYGTDIQKQFPNMAKNIAQAAQRDVSSLPLLAVPPVVLEKGASSQDADTLAQILTIHLIQTGKYAVYPRTKNLEQVVQVAADLGGNSSDAADEYLPRIGRGSNPRLVLSVIRRGDNSFNASIINMETNTQEAGAAVEYQSLEDGIEVMEVLALRLTGRDAEADEKARKMAFSAERTRLREETANRREEKAAARRQRRLDEKDARLYSVGATAGSSFTAPWVIAGIGGAFSVWKHTFFDAGLDAGFVHGYEADIQYFSLYPYAHFNLLVPFHDDYSSNIFSLHVGAGAGLMAAFYEIDDEKNTLLTPALDLTAGLITGPKKYYASIAYSFRTPFEQIFTAVNHRAVLGFGFRFH